jgi:hypothetical protein
MSPMSPMPHYKIICISLYSDDLKRLDVLVETLKARGCTRANRSALIRCMILGINLEHDFDRVATYLSVPAPGSKQPDYKKTPVQT